MTEAVEMQCAIVELRFLPTEENDGYRLVMLRQAQHDTVARATLGAVSSFDCGASRLRSG